MIQNPVGGFKNLHESWNLYRNLKKAKIIRKLQYLTVAFDHVIFLQKSLESCQESWNQATILKIHSLGPLYKL